VSEQRPELRCTQCLPYLNERHCVPLEENGVVCHTEFGGKKDMADAQGKCDKCDGERGSPHQTPICHHR
ncbi:MAG TPA: hypothetical protein VNM48_22225, partial [Chloroflexota bacterium]|nr:hypothetical protein [Chloroflexota bacterium]